MAEDIAAVSQAALDSGLPPEGEMLPIESAPLGPAISLDILARRLPKAELHLHFEGAIRPSALAPLARRAGDDALADRARPDGPCDYRGGTKFFNDLARIGAVVTHPDVCTEAALGVLADAVDNGCRHLELMVTAGFHAEHAGRDPRKILEDLAAAFRTAADLWGITGGVIVEFDRPAGGEAARDLATVAADAADDGLPVLGVGNDGNPLTLAFEELAPGYELARERGLKLCGHCDLPWDIQPALDLGLDRIDHGFTALLDEAVLAEIVRRQVPLTICPTSNIVMMPGAYSDYDTHPLAGLVAAGVNVALSTDDGPLYYTDLAQEYAAAARALGWGPTELADAVRRSLRAAWLDPTAAKTRLPQWDAEIDALIADPRLTQGL